MRFDAGSCAETKAEKANGRKCSYIQPTISRKSSKRRKQCKWVRCPKGMLEVQVDPQRRLRVAVYSQMGIAERGKESRVAGA